MSIITYEDRIAKIKVVEDIDKQISLATAYAKRLRTKAKKCTGTLADKLAMNELYKQAKIVSHELKLNYFKIEDGLR